MKALTLLLILSAVIYGQVPELSPKAASFQVPTEVQPAANGALNINLPLLSLPGSKNFSYNFDLNYTSGVRYFDRGSMAGMGWSYPMFQIRRVVHGYPDEFDYMNIKFQDAQGFLRTRYLRTGRFGWLDYRNYTPLFLGTAVDVDRQDNHYYSFQRAFGYYIEGGATRALGTYRQANDDYFVESCMEHMDDYEITSPVGSGNLVFYCYEIINAQYPDPDNNEFLDQPFYGRRTPGYDDNETTEYKIYFAIQDNKGAQVIMHIVRKHSFPDGNAAYRYSQFPDTRPHIWWELKDTDGNVYVFGKENPALSSGFVVHNLTSSRQLVACKSYQGELVKDPEYLRKNDNSYGDVYWEGMPNSTTGNFTIVSTQYMLSQIYRPGPENERDEIFFNYELKEKDQATLRKNQDYVFGGGDAFLGHLQPGESTVYGSIVYNEVRKFFLKSVETATHKMEFIYSDLLALKKDREFFRLPTTVQIIHKPTGSLLKRVALGYEYYINNVSVPLSPFEENFGAYTDAEELLVHKVLLARIQETASSLEQMPPYELSYILHNEIIEYQNYRITDNWGYCNLNRPYKPFDMFYFDHPESLLTFTNRNRVNGLVFEYRIWNGYGFNGSYGDHGSLANLEFNSGRPYAANWSLRKIVYPTGATNTFYYAPAGEYHPDSHEDRISTNLAGEEELAVPPFSSNLSNPNRGNFSGQVRHSRVDGTTSFVLLEGLIGLQAVPDYPFIETVGGAPKIVRVLSDDQHGRKVFTNFDYRDALAFQVPYGKILSNNLWNEDGTITQDNSRCLFSRYLPYPDIPRLNSFRDPNPAVTEIWVDGAHDPSYLSNGFLYGQFDATQKPKLAKDLVMYDDPENPWSQGHFTAKYAGYRHKDAHPANMIVYGSVYSWKTEYRGLDTSEVPYYSVENVNSLNGFTKISYRFLKQWEEGNDPRTVSVTMLNSQHQIVQHDTMIYEVVEPELQEYYPRNQLGYLAFAQRDYQADWRRRYSQTYSHDEYGHRYVIENGMYFPKMRLTRLVQQISEREGVKTILRNEFVLPGEDENQTITMFEDPLTYATYFCHVPFSPYNSPSVTKLFAVASDGTEQLKKVIKRKYSLSKWATNKVINGYSSMADENGNLFDMEEYFYKSNPFGGNFPDVLDSQLTKAGRERFLEYDTYGNVLKKKTGLGTIWDYTFENNGLNLSNVKQDNEQQLSAQYDPVTLQISSLTNKNGFTHAFRYDPWGRLSEVSDDNGYSEKYTYTYSRKEQNNWEYQTAFPNCIMTEVTNSENRVHQLATYFSPLGIELQKHRRLADLANISVSEFDLLGKPIKKFGEYQITGPEIDKFDVNWRANATSYNEPYSDYLPDKSNTGYRFTSLEYYIDPLNRIKKIIPQGYDFRETSQEFTYSKNEAADLSGYLNGTLNKTIVKDENGVLNASFTDANGATSGAIKDYGVGGANVTTTIFNNPLGKVSRIETSMGRTVTFNYNYIGWLIKRDKGEYNEIIYDVAGNARLLLDTKEIQMDNNVNITNTWSPPSRTEVSTSGSFDIARGRLDLLLSANNSANVGYFIIEIFSDAERTVVLKRIRLDLNTSNSIASTIYLPMGTYYYKIKLAALRPAGLLCTYSISSTKNSFCFYNNYDVKNRLIESGEVVSDAPSSNYVFNQNNAFVRNFPNEGDKLVLKKLFYDTVYPEFEATQTYTSGNLSYDQSYSTFDGSLMCTQFYSYDSKGRMNWMIQRVPGQNDRKIVFSYDAADNILSQEVFTPGLTNTRLQYEYDSFGRLVHIYHGAKTFAGLEYFAGDWLKRLQLADLQGLDYRYNARGWLTQINHQNLNATQDPGHDSPEGNSVKSDLFGMVFGYNDSQGHVGSLYSNRQQLTGNISWMMYQMKKSENEVISDPFHPGWGLVGYSFNYDRLNRLSDANFGVWGNNLWNVSPAYNLSMAYTGDGNISSMIRHSPEKNNGPVDQLTYNYVSGRDRLDHVSDAVAGSVAPNDMDSQLPGNYTYDQNGNMTSDKANKIAFIIYNGANLPEQIFTTNGVVFKYAYNCSGKRVLKTTPSSTMQYLYGMGLDPVAVFTNNNSYYVNVTANGKIVGRIQK